MTRRTDRLGRLGEQIAVDYLVQRGYRVVERNARRREGEIDLVTVQGDTLVFVEVKLRASDAMGQAVEALSAAKQRRLVQLSEAYASDHPELPAVQRIDVVAVDMTARGVLRSVRHIESAVEG